MQLDACVYVGAGALHGPVRHKACRGPHSPVEPGVVSELLRLTVGGRLPGVHQGDAVGEHTSESTSLCTDCYQVPRTADDTVAD